MCRSVGMADYVYSSANRAGDLISLKIICDTSIQRILIDLLNAGGFNIIDYVWKYRPIWWLIGVFKSFRYMYRTRIDDIFIKWIGCDDRRGLGMSINVFYAYTFQKCVGFDPGDSCRYNEFLYHALFHEWLALYRFDTVVYRIFSYCETGHWKQFCLPWIQQRPVIDQISSILINGEFCKFIVSERIGSQCLEILR